MSTNHNRSWIPLLVVFWAVLQSRTPVNAFVTSLGGGGPQDPGAMRSSAADVLYATDKNGREVKVVGTDSSLDDGMPLDLGLPSVGPDGTVFFAAAFRRNSRVRWEIFAANPDDYSLSQVAPHSSFPALEMVTDPTPLAQSDGSIVFAAREISRGDGLYHLQDGKLSCLVRVGMNLDGNRVLRNIAFGSFSAVRGRAAAFTGYVTPGGKAELLVTDRKVTVLAVVGERSPDGTRYRDLGPPATRGLQAVNVAFPAVTDGGERVYEYKRGKVSTIMSTGSPCTTGKITYISQDRLGLDSDGTVVVGAICSDSPAIFLVRRSVATILVSAAREPDHSGFVDLGKPSLLDAGTVLFSASKADGTGIYSIHPNLGSPVTVEAALPLTSSADPLTPPRHSILTVSLASNARGRLAYLGGPIESFASVPTP